MAQLFDGNTALHVACTNRSVDVIHFLLEKKANPMAVVSWLLLLLLLLL